MKVIDFYREGFFSTYVVSGSEESPAAYVIRVLRAADGSKAVNYEVFLRSLPDGPSDHTSVPVGLLPFILEAMSEKETPYEGPFEAGPWLDVAALKAEVREAFGQGVEFGSYSSEARTTLPSNTFVTWTREDPTWTREGYEEVCRRRAISQLSQSEIRFRLELGARFDQNLVTRVILEVMAERASG